MMRRTIHPFPARAVFAAAVSLSLVAARPLEAQTPVEEPAFQTPSNQGVAVEVPTPKRGPATGSEKRTAESASTPVNRSPVRHQQFLDRTKLGKVDLLLLGDSFLDQMPRVGEWTWLQMASYNPADFGAAGERTEDVLWRVQNGELEGIHPKVVVVAVGTLNLANKTEQPEWVGAGVKKIVDAVHEKLPGTPVIVLGLMPRGAADDPARSRIEAVDTILAKLDDGKATRYFDVGKKFLDEKGNLLADLMRDKASPTAKAYEVWWGALHPVVDTVMAAATATPSPSPTPSPTPTATPTPTPTPTPSSKAASPTPKSSPSPAKAPKPK